MTEAEFTAFLMTVLSLGARYSVDSALHSVSMDWRHQRELLSTGGSIFNDYLNLFVWNKTNGGMGSFYRSKHELKQKARKLRAFCRFCSEISVSLSLPQTVWRRARVSKLHRANLAPHHALQCL
jgi:hypothetical protein